MKEFTTEKKKKEFTTENVPVSEKAFSLFTYFISLDILYKPITFSPTLVLRELGQTQSPK